MDMIVAGAIFLLTIFPAVNESKKQASSPSLTPPTASKIPITSTPTPIPTEKPKEPKIHEVSTGDTMDSIAIKYYGSSKYWTTLWNDNDGIVDPRIIRSGMKLNIREVGPKEVEKLNPKLIKVQDEVLSLSPSPTLTPAPTQEVKGTETSQTPTPTAPERTPAPAGSFEEVYKQAGAKYGVPWEILYGLHHMETGGRDGAISSGYGTGAQGPLQFMPGTWAAYGADGNGDGVNDINNAVDAIHGAANYLVTHGGIEQGLKSYGGNSELVYQYARSRGWSQ